MGLSVAGAIAQAVAADGADRAFVFPGGGSNLEVIAALEGVGVHVVLAHSETAAVLMASAYADLIGRPALVLVGLGPGVASAVNGVAHARLDQSAVVIVSDTFAAADRGQTGHQVLDQAALLAPVAKAQAALEPAGAEETVRWALATAAAPPRGPVHLELSADVALAPARSGTGVAASTSARSGTRVPASTSARSGTRVPAGNPAPAASRPDAVVPLVAAAHRPVVLVGDEALSIPQPALVGLVERLAAPVLVTPKAKGALPEDHPLWCGIVTNAALEAPLLDRADLLVAVGVDPVELLSKEWTFGAPVAALREHDEPVPGYRPRHLVIGDLPAMVHALGSDAGEWTAAEIADARAAMLAAVRVGADAGLTALAAVEEAQARAPEAATVTVDAGAHMFAALWGWRSTRPRRFLISNGLATMGFAVPAAIAAALAGDALPVVAICGDGGFLLHGNELETAARVGARIVVLVLNDSSLGLIRVKQADRGHPRRAVDFGPVDVAAYARSLGAAGYVAGTRAEVGDAVSRALSDPRPAVVDVRITGSEYDELQRVIRVGGAAAAVRGEPACLP